MENKWVNETKDYASKHNIHYKEALSSNTNRASYHGEKAKNLDNRDYQDIMIDISVEAKKFDKVNKTEYIKGSYHYEKNDKKIKDNIEILKKVIMEPKLVKEPKPPKAPKPPKEPKPVKAPKPPKVNKKK